MRVPSVELCYARHSTWPIEHCRRGFPVSSSLVLDFSFHMEVKWVFANVSMTGGKY